MNGEEVAKLLKALADGIKQRSIAVQCECENLETVYVLVDEAGNLRVTDSHQTFKYLEEANDRTYKEIKNLDIEEIREVCKGLGVELKDAPPDGYRSIEAEVQPGELIADTVARVADAIDRVFSFAVVDSLKA